MLVEAAISIPSFLLVVGGMIDYGIAIRENSVIASAARAGARAAASLTISDSTFIRVVACQSARNFLAESNLSPAKFLVITEPATVPAPVPPDPTILPNAIKVTVQHIDPPWYLYFRKTYRGSATSIFMTESGESVDEVETCV
jgi:hypothetical protein